jgi:hypothetical protein
MAALRRGLGALLVGVLAAAGATVLGQRKRSRTSPLPPPPASSRQPAAATTAFRGGINCARRRNRERGDGAVVADLAATSRSPRTANAEIRSSSSSSTAASCRDQRAGAAADPHRRRRGGRSRARRRPAVRVLLDDYHVRRKRAGQPAGVSRFIGTQLGPTDMIAIMARSSRSPRFASPATTRRPPWIEQFVAASS